MDAERADAEAPVEAAGREEDLGYEDQPMTVRLTRAERDRLDDIAERLGYSRSHLVRLILRRGLASAQDFAPRDRSADVWVPEGSRGPPERASGAA